MRSLTISICTLLILILGGLGLWTLRGQVPEPDYAAQTGSVFYPEPANPFGNPQVWEIKPPIIPDSESIWGITQRGSIFEWVVLNLAENPRRSKSFRIATGSLQRVLLYGSITTDDLGKIYAVGWAADAQGGQRPLVLQIMPAR